MCELGMRLMIRGRSGDDMRRLLATALYGRPREGLLLAHSALNVEHLLEKERKIACTVNYDQRVRPFFFSCFYSSRD